VLHRRDITMTAGHCINYNVARPTGMFGSCITIVTVRLVLQQGTKSRP